MPLPLAVDLINFCAELNVSMVVLIGGEPTIHPHFLEIVNYVKTFGLKCGVITNGYRFSNKEFVKKSLNYGLDFINFSVKAVNQNEQRRIAPSCDFKNVISAMVNINNTEINCTYSVVLTEQMLEDLENLAYLLNKYAKKNFLNLNFCGYKFNKSSEKNKDILSVKEYIQKFIVKFDSASRILEGRIMLFQSLPLCWWPESFIEKLKFQQQIASVCHLFNHNGLVLDIDGSCLPCNRMYSHPIGKFRVDFFDKKSFEQFWTSKKIITSLKALCMLPYDECVSCKKYNLCAGGCPIC